MSEDWEGQNDKWVQNWEAVANPDWPWIKDNVSGRTVRADDGWAWLTKHEWAARLDHLSILERMIIEIVVKQHWEVSLRWLDSIGFNDDSSGYWGFTYPPHKMFEHFVQELKEPWTDIHKNLIARIRSAIAGTEWEAK